MCWNSHWVSLKLLEMQMFLRQRSRGFLGQKLKISFSVCWGLPSTAEKEKDNYCKYWLYSLLYDKFSITVKQDSPSAISRNKFVDFDLDCQIYWEIYLSFNFFISWKHEAIYNLATDHDQIYFRLTHFQFSYLALDTNLTGTTGVFSNIK